MTEEKYKQVNEVIEITNAPVLQCYNALVINDWNNENAVQSIFDNGIDELSYKSNLNGIYTKNEIFLPELFHQKINKSRQISILKRYALISLILGLAMIFIYETTNGIYPIILSVILVVIAIIIYISGINIRKNYNIFKLTDEGKSHTYFLKDRNIVLSSQHKKLVEEKNKKVNDAHQDYLNKKFLKKISGKKYILKHFQGLPTSAGINVTLELHEDKFIFSIGQSEYILNTDKIIDISFTTDSEIQHNYVSSVGGAVGGAILFGPIGAAIGGRAKHKTDTTVTSYLIFTYNGKNGIEYIGFENPNPELLRLLDEYKKQNDFGTTEKIVQEL